MNSPSTNSSDSSSTINNDSTYIFGYSSEVNDNKHLKYSNSINVNLDFIKYVNLCKFSHNTHCSKINRHKVNILLESINKKQMLFYSDDNYEEFKILTRSYTIIRNYMNTYYKVKKHKLEYVNDCSLLLQPIDSVEFIINLKIRNKIYRYSVSDIIQIYNHTLKHIDEKAYINGDLESPKNPYTNIEFTFVQNISIYTQLLDYYKLKKGYIPNYIVGYKECYFNTDTYFARFYNNIMNTSISQYLENCTDERFEEEFDDMIKNASKNMKELYCPTCYKKHNIRLLFTDAVKTFILNSNDIYLYGYYESIFKLIASAHEINFKDGHRLRHRRKFKGRRGYERRRPQRSSGNIGINTPLFNFTFANSESVSENVLGSTYFNVGNNNLSTNNLFTFPGVISDNTMLDRENLFNFVSSSNSINGENNVLLNFTNNSLISNEFSIDMDISVLGRNELNSPMNVPEINYLTDLFTTPISTTNINMRELRVINNQHFDEEMSLSSGTDSIESPNNSTSDESNQSEI